MKNTLISSQKSLKLAGASLLLLLIGTACTQYASQWSSSKDAYAPLSNQEAAIKLNYAYVKSNILDKYCTTCHGTEGGVNLETSDGVRAHLQEILRDMESKSMPKAKEGVNTVMTDSDRQILYDWVKAGAPIGTGVIQPLYPPLSPADAAQKLNYAYVQANILVPMCMSCHGDDGKVSVEDIDSIRASAYKMMVVVTGDKSMPKGGRGKKMTEDQRSVLYNWLLTGAPVGDAPVPSAYNSYPPLSDQDAAAKLNFNYIRDNILIPKCISCHDKTKDVNLETYDGIQDNLRDIKFAVFSKAPSMPPFGKLKFGWDPVTQPIPDPIPPNRILTDSDMQVFYNWVIQGAPQGGAIIDPLPIKPTFDDINQRIFQVRCMDCHDPAIPHHPVALTKESLLSPNEDYVKPGDPDNSTLVISLSQSTASDPDPDPKPMPPAKKGYEKLPDADFQAIKDWIKNGAKD